LKTFERIE
jgi:Ran GTPase-activating protein (RanGAP) involved in mRNA processing and transport